jgi:NADPH-dependent 2,4-dienoyl-CoA reductase/sulfur reductase-like enzyme
MTDPNIDGHKRQVIVIGGGAAGLIAAGQAAELGAETLLLEKMDRPGRKLRGTQATHHRQGTLQSDQYRSHVRVYPAFWAQWTLPAPGFSPVLLR